MPLFVCEGPREDGICRTIDNTACRGDWLLNRVRPALYADPSYCGKALCCVCRPKHFADGKPTGAPGKWHDHFPRERATVEMMREIYKRNKWRDYIYLGPFEYLRAELK